MSGGRTAEKGRGGQGEMGEGQPEEQPSHQPGGEECQGGAYGVSLGTYGGHVETISPPTGASPVGQEVPENKPEVLADLLGQASQWVRLSKAGKPLRKATGNDRCKKNSCNGEYLDGKPFLLLVKAAATAYRAEGSSYSNEPISQVCCQSDRDIREQDLRPHLLRE